MKAYAKAPDGRTYEVASVPRGALVLEGRAVDAAAWVTPLFAYLGLIGWLVNRAAFGGRWMIRVRPYVDSPRGPVTGAIHGSWEMSKAEAFGLLEEMARRIRQDGFEVSSAWLSSALAHRNDGAAS